MAKQRRSTVRGSYLPIALMAITAIGMLGISGVLMAWALGAFDKQSSDPIDRTGKLAFPAISRPKGAYESLTRDDFINPQTGELNVIWLPEATAQVASRNMSELIGRVLCRDKQAGMVLTEADLMERGTRPGLVAGIPSGKYAVSIPVSDIPGMEQLRGGDRFDLLVSLPLREDGDQLANSEPAALFGGIKPPSLQVSQLSRRHGVKHLVTDGTLVTLFRGEKRSTSGPTGLTVTPSANTRANAGSDPLYAELAVDPDEIGPLTEAISLGTKMTCVLRSGLPGGKDGDAMSTDGLVPVITTALPVKAFSSLSDENLMDESTGRLHYYYFPPDKVSSEWITDPAQLYGRVVARPLRRGSLITESDLLPKGTRPGISAGLPPGMAGMSLSKANVQGFENLAIGDSFSILTRVPEDVAAAPASISWATLQGGQLSDDDARITEMLRTGIREVVKQAVFLSESTDDNVVIGIPELEVPKLAQLIRDKAEVFAVARSTRQSSENSADKPSVMQGTAAPAESSRLPKATVQQVEVRRVAHLDTYNHDIELQLSEAAVPVRRINQNDALEWFDATPQNDNRVSVPILVKEVPAFQAISVEDFLDPATGRIRTLLFDPAKLNQDWERDIRNLVDRVPVRTLQAGRPVRSTDLAPAGTMPGPAAGLESGMRGVTVNADQIIGLQSLPIGSVFDLVSASGVEISALGDKVRPSISSPDAVKEAAKLWQGRVAAARPVALNVRLLSNVGTVKVTVPRVGAVTKRQSQTQMTADGSTVTETVESDPTVFEERTVPQFVLAVPVESVGEVLGLLDVNYPLQVSLRPSKTNQSESSGDALNLQGEPATSAQPIRAVIQEHVRGQDIQSEVFITDHAGSAAAASSMNPQSRSFDRSPSNSGEAP